MNGSSSADQREVLPHTPRGCVRAVRAASELGGGERRIGLEQTPHVGAVARADDNAPVVAAVLPGKPLGLDTALQSRAWRVVVSHGGRLLRTEAVAKELKVSREHLSRSFAAAGKPNLKRIIDLVRLIAAAELAKNSGYDVSDVARLLEFASPSHLSSTSQRIIGTRSVSLARLRTVDLIERFRQGRGRSRNR